MVDSRMRYTDYGDNATGVEPNDWRHRYESSGGFVVRDDAGAIGGKHLEIDSDSFVFTWDELPEAKNVEVYYRTTTIGGSGFGNAAAGLRIGDGDGEGDVYFEDGTGVEVRISPFNVEVTVHVEGSSAGVESSGDVSMTDGVEYDILVRAYDDDVSLKIWESTDPEPDGWDVTFEGLLSGIDLEGHTGYRNQSGSDSEVDTYAVGWDGAAAPRAALEDAVELQWTINDAEADGQRVYSATGTDPEFAGDYTLETDLDPTVNGWADTELPSMENTVHYAVTAYRTLNDDELESEPSTTTVDIEPGPELSGTTTLESDPVQGRLAAIGPGGSIVFGPVDASLLGLWSLNVDDLGDYHVFAEYEDDDGQYNALSKPDVGAIDDE